MSATAERFWTKVSGGDIETCWQWTGRPDSKGYGSFRVNGRKVKAHRWSYEHLRAEIPAGLVIDHLCRVPACVNPWHLEPVTSAVNTARGKHASSAKTHCPSGHPYSAENTYIPARGDRQCRTCNRERSSARYHDPSRIEAARTRSREYQRNKRSNLTRSNSA